MKTKAAAPKPTPATHTRRDFIRELATAVAVSTAGVSLFAQNTGGKEILKPLVGTQLYGWSQYYEREKRNLGKHIPEVLSAIRDAGYDYAESTLDLNQPENNAGFATRLREKGLRPVSFYTGGRLHEEGKAAETIEKILAAAKICQREGFAVINCNPDPIGREKTDAELKTQAAALTELGRGLRKLGMWLGIHHHTPEFANHAKEFHHNFRHSAASEVGFCYDVHWVFRGGVMPMDALREYGNRVVSWHLRQSRDGIWWEDLDQGDIDYATVARFAKQHNLPPRYTVELALEQGTKITRSVIENHRRSREFVRAVFAA
ncbi:MAG: sugar phosphate isomerase/epimerase [Verrucomicrobia bacterium]|nr:sugar phosphate isomerase/epimerase [Verrucomicrobiota bacterium]